MCGSAVSLVIVVVGVVVVNIVTFIVIVTVGIGRMLTTQLKVMGVHIPCHIHIQIDRC